ncbi:carbon-nitrogen hydrolase family protein [Porticoccus sp. W117]|uniref:carbon-nitrogen hydrolase family protein n=1 Tax=Porticoccus sp. W117 TaxID=3054777 RepID=UPI002591A946|nr:carbon-nitrogen hydrolase family protein [Porticoccus sp. W117]MDM3872061.1 carbon-nitrogen hydrolase family protein [Porticoccus sp. W117]
MTHSSELTVALGQISPVWLDREKTVEKILAAISEAADKGAQLIAFGEALLPGYPFWLERTGGAVFNSSMQKQIHAHYLQQAVDIEAGHLEPVCQLARQQQISVILGIAERPADRGSHSLYCSLVYIDTNGVIQNVHRKLMPTYEERLTWSPGDGHGLRTHPLGPFTLGALNCWENWMPLPRAALYAQGENLHVAIWPGGDHNTENITRFIAQEGRSYVLSASSLMKVEDFPIDTPYLEEITSGGGPLLANGGSCIAAPDGSWVIEPQVGTEGVYVATIDHNRVLEERQNFDPAGHYSRPDVTQLSVNRQRQCTVLFKDSEGND